MFQPHSVRGLLSRRNVSRIQEDSNSNDIQTNGDPDLQSIVETKLIIKDIDHQIEGIRQWRDNQKIILNERLSTNKANKAAADTLVQSYLGNLQRQQKREAQQQLQLITQLQNTDIKGLGLSEQEIRQENAQSSDTNLFDYVTNSNNRVEECKYEVSSQAASILAQQTLANEVNCLSQLMTRPREGNGQLKKNVDKQLLKKELEQIQAQLREVQELLKD